MMEVKILTRINDRYHVFDTSGKLPFSIVFGLVRRASADTEPRALLFDLAGSILDVPYAVSRGLLSLQVYDTSSKEWHKVNVDSLGELPPASMEHISLSSPVGRTQRWREAMITHKSFIDPKNAFTSILASGKKYRLRIAGENIGVGKWTWLDKDEGKAEDGDLGPRAEGRLIAAPHSGGNADFKVVDSLPWPPSVEINLRLHALMSGSSSSDGDSNETFFTLEAIVTNQGSEVITVQTRGHHNIIVPWGPEQPELEFDDEGPRVLDQSPGISCLEFVSVPTGRTAWIRRPTGIHPLYDTKADRRPKKEDLVFLEPAIRFARVMDIGSVVARLDDGNYKVRMHRRGCRWWPGQLELGDDGRVPRPLLGRDVPPLMLESNDEVLINVKDGRIESGE